MARSVKLGAEIVFNIILMVLGLFIIYQSFQLGLGTLKRPGSGLFILLVGVPILGLSTISLARGSGARIEALFKDNEGRKFIVLAIPFLAWILLIDIMGYVLVTFLCTLSLSKLFKLPGWWRPLLLSFCTALLCYIVFEYILVSDLPRGLWR